MPWLLVAGGRGGDQHDDYYSYRRVFYIIVMCLFLWFVSFEFTIRPRAVRTSAGTVVIGGSRSRHRLLWPFPVPNTN